MQAPPQVNRHTVQPHTPDSRPHKLRCRWQRAMSRRGSHICARVRPQSPATSLTAPLHHKVPMGRFRNARLTPAAGMLCGGMHIRARQRSAGCGGRKPCTERAGGDGSASGRDIVCNKWRARPGGGLTTGTGCERCLAPKHFLAGNSESAAAAAHGNRRRNPVTAKPARKRK